MTGNTQRRILIMIPSLVMGGAERLMITLLRHLDRSALEVHLALVRKEGLFLRDVPEDIPVIDLGSRRVRFALPRIVGLVRRLRPDVVFTTLRHLNLSVMAVRSLMPRNTRFVAREAGVVRREGGYATSSVGRRICGRLYSGFDTVVCQSEFMRNDLVTELGLREDRLVVVHNPVEVGRIDAFVQSRKDAGRFSSRGINLLAVGRLEHVKGFDMLLEAFSLIRSGDFTLTLIGGGPEERKLHELAEGLGIADRCAFLGPRENPFGHMADADLLVCSSRCESFPNVVLEAMVCGTPVVAFDCPGGIGEIVCHGDNGWLVEAGNVGQLAEAIAVAARHQWNPARIRASVEGRFDAKSIVRQYEEIFLLCNTTVTGC